MLVAEWARARPDAVAVIAGPERMTYRELDERANRVAHHLRERGVGREVPVGVCVGRGTWMIVALLAVLKAGGAFVPLDPEQPQDRLTFMLDDIGRPLVLAQEARRDWLRAAGAGEVVCLDTAWDTISRHPATPPQDDAGPGDLAYVIFTSGSTGRPKGVQVEHGSLGARIVELREQYGLTSADTVLQFASLAFDGSLGQILPALAAGATLVVRPDRWDPAWLLEAIREFGVTVCELPPPVWNLLMDTLDAGGRLSPAVRLVALGGERVQPAQVLRWFELSDVPLFNVYGPSETTVTATTALIDRPLPRIPIGRPIGHTEVFVLDGDGRLVPPGVVGELWVGARAWPVVTPTGPS